MPEIKIPFNDKLIDLNQTPSVKIVQSNGNFQLQIQVGLKKPATNGRSDSKNSRLADIDFNIFSSGKGAIALKKIEDGDPASKLKFVFEATVNTKVPHTGVVFSEFDLQPLSAFMEV